MDYSKIALFSDLDGTLFDDSTQVQKRNLEALRRFTEQADCSASARDARRITPLNICRKRRSTVPASFITRCRLQHCGEAVCPHAQSRQRGAVSPAEKLLAEQPAINIQVYNTEAICFVSPRELADEWFVSQHQLRVPFSGGGARSVA